jgi:hypothetical protein
MIYRVHARFGMGGMPPIIFPPCFAYGAVLILYGTQRALPERGHIV